MALMDFFRPKWKHSNFSVANDAARRIIDQSELAKVAKKAHYFDVRDEAVKRLTDQAVLAEIARRDDDTRVRIKCLERLTELSATSASALIKGMLNDPDDHARHEAMLLAASAAFWSALDYLPISEKVEMCLRALDTPYDADVRHQDMLALDYLPIDDSEKVEMCLRALHTPYVDVEKWAVEYLSTKASDQRVSNALVMRFVMLTASGEESNDYDGYHGTHTVYLELGIVTRAEADKKQNQYCHLLGGTVLGGAGSYHFRELTEEERKGITEEQKLSTLRSSASW